MDDQNEAWRRLTDARLRYLEAAVKPQRIRRGVKGQPLPPLAYEPGDRFPLTRWLSVRLDAMELLLRLLLDADEERADEDLSCASLEELMTPTLAELEAWTDEQIEPDLHHRETMAAILFARVIMTENPAWPLSGQ